MFQKALKAAGGSGIKEIVCLMNGYIVPGTGYGFNGDYLDTNGNCRWNCPYISDALNAITTNEYIDVKQGTSIYDPIFVAKKAGKYRYIDMYANGGNTTNVTEVDCAAGDTITTWKFSYASPYWCYGIMVWAV